MKILGKQVKIIKPDVARKGEIGTVIGKQKTMIGLLWEIEFDGGERGLYSINDFVDIGGHF